MTKVDKNGLLNGAIEALTNQREEAYYCIYDKNYVYVGDEIQPNLDYVSNHNLEIVNIPTIGGTIVVGEGDFGFGFTSFDLDKVNSFNDAIRDRLIALINSKGFETSIEHNDILVNGFKVASYCSLIRGRVFLGIFQISMNVDLELIRNICNKPMVKIPKSLTEFGVTSSEIEQLILEVSHDFGI